MNTPKTIAAHLYQVYFGGNWTAVNLKSTLKDVRLEKAQEKTGSFNSILALSYHIHYYAEAILNVLEGHPLLAKDKYSFDHPTISTEHEWQTFLDEMFKTGKDLVDAIENVDSTLLNTHFTKEEFGTYSRNFLGLIEHTHYHLGQIVLLKKMQRPNHEQGEFSELEDEPLTS